MSRVRSVTVGAVTALTLVGSVAAPAAAAGQVYYVPASDEVVVHGHGYGHGAGMSQYGAEGAARQGRTHREILSFYYPGTTFGRTSGNIRVLITADDTSDVKVSPTAGLSVRDRSDGRAWTLPTTDGIDRWRILADGRVQKHLPAGWRGYDLGGRGRLRGEGEFFADGPITLWVPSGSGEVARAYRGALRSAHVPGRGADRDTVNVLPMDSYVRGVVPYEMPASWSQEALRSQAVAARTYAANDRMRNRSRYYQTCDTTSCQVYGGVGSEQDSTDRAVRGTAHTILRYGGDPAFTQFSASSGGYTAAGSAPYLQAKKDPWDDWSGNGVHTWTATVSATSLERRYPALGRLSAIRVLERNGHGQWGGRVVRLRLDGTRGDVDISGDDFRWAYGLRSSWFSIERTPIIARWHRIGAGRSLVGSPLAAERAAAGGGAVQRFERGRIYWSQDTGARELHGRILAHYLGMGGVTSALDYPRSAVTRAGDRGRKVVFEGGRLYYTPGHGVHGLRGEFLSAYARTGWAKGRLGLPVTDTFDVRVGKRQRFQGGRITWVRATGQTRVWFRP